MFSTNPGNGKHSDPLAVIRYFLSTAITIGAPAYNHGDRRGCYDVYACTARLLLNTIQGAESSKLILREALEKSSIVPDVDQQAWIMRHAFAAILEPAKEDDELPDL
jgi:hypothetical protein